MENTKCNKCAGVTVENGVCRNCGHTEAKETVASTVKKAIKKITK